MEMTNETLALELEAIIDANKDNPLVAGIQDHQVQQFVEQGGDLVPATIKAINENELPAERLPKLMAYADYMVNEFSDDMDYEDEPLSLSTDLSALPYGVGYVETPELAQLYPNMPVDTALSLEGQTDYTYNALTDTIDDIVPVPERHEFSYPDPMPEVPLMDVGYLAMADLPKEEVRKALGSDYPYYEVMENGSKGVNPFREDALVRDAHQMQRDGRYLEAAMEATGLNGHDTYQEAYPGLEEAVITAAKEHGNVVDAIKQELTSSPLTREDISHVMYEMRTTLLTEAMEVLPPDVAQELDADAFMKNFEEAHSKELAGAMKDIQTFNRPKESLATAIEDIYYDNDLGDVPKDVKDFTASYETKLGKDDSLNYATPGLGDDVYTLRHSTRPELQSVNQPDLLRYRVGEHVRESFVKEFSKEASKTVDKIHVKENAQAPKRPKVVVHIKSSTDRGNER